MREKIPVIRLRAKSGILVARDGIDLCFFMRRSHQEVAAAAWRALQAYLRAIPPQSLNWYGSDDGDTLPLDEKGWEVIRKQMLERPWGSAWIVELEESCDEAGGYHFEYHGRKLDDPLYARNEDATSGLIFTFPTEYLLAHGAAHLRTLALELARELPFSFGYASLAFVAPRGQWYAARRELLDTLWRFLGLNIEHLAETSCIIGPRARGAYWLTFLGQPLLGQLGGLEGLRTRLPFPEVSLQPLEGERLLLTLGEWPDAIDTQTGAVPAQYRALARLLEPFLYEARGVWPPLNQDFMHRWLRRLCQ